MSSVSQKKMQIGMSYHIHPPMHLFLGVSGISLEKRGLLTRERDFTQCKNGAELSKLPRFMFAIHLLILYLKGPTPSIYGNVICHIITGLNIN